jgi:calcium-dependent protein kinase
MSDPPDPLAAYDTKRIHIGRGRYAHVFKTRHLATGTEVAMKIISSLSEERHQQFVKEFDLLTRSQQHPNVIGIHDCFIVASKGYLILQLCEGDTLSSKLSSDGALPDFEAARVIHSVLLALNHMHSRNVVHRDIKPDNIMYLRTDPGSDVLLGDFGLGKFVGEGLADSRVGTKGYQAPQILQGHLYDCKCDIWSTGVVAYELLHARLPFRDNQQEAKLLKEMMGGLFAIEPGINAQAADFIRACLQPDPARRPDAATLLNHPWFRQLGGQPRRN